MTTPILLALLLAAAASGAPAAAPEPAAVPGGPRSPASPARSAPLRALLDEHVDWLMRDDPVSASIRGDERFNALLRDESPAAYAQREADLAARLARLRAIDRAGFTEDDHLDADLLDHDLALYLDGVPLRGQQLPVSSMDGPHIWLPQIADMVPMRTAAHLADYASRLEAMPRQIDDTITQMRAGLEARRVPPKVVLAQTVAAVRQQADPATAERPESSPFFTPFARPGVDPAVVARAKTAIAAGLVPAFARLADFLEKEYIPRCRDTIGISQGVDGPAAYQYRLRQHTTTAMTIDEIHALGLAEVARLKAEMIAVIQETDFPLKASLSGDALFDAFVADLRTNPRFYFTDAEEMLRGYRDICKRMDAELPKLFRHLPRNTYGVRAIPKFAAMTSPAAYCYPGSIKSGVPGYFMVNTYALDQRPRYGMVSLTLHEAVPGHHLQSAITDELDLDQPGLHPYRTLAGNTAYVEGWALYCELLGLEVGDSPQVRAPDGTTSGGRGFYADPYDNFGRLSDEIWRACRLVVDTGLHAKGWTRQAAIDYMLANSAGTEVDTVSEIDRYISWPGQACAYKIGQLTILNLRRRAERDLGAAFDVRAFHDAVLGAGVLPLPVLEKRMGRWIEARRNLTPP